MEENRRDAGNQPSLTAAKTAEASSPAEPTPRRRSAGQKRKANNSAVGSTTSSTPSKRLAREKQTLSLSTLHNGPSTRARQSQNNLAVSGVTSSGTTDSVPVYESIKLVEAIAILGGEEEAKVRKEEWEALEAEIEKEFEAIRSRDRNVHIVPVFCGWFSWKKVHPIEEKTMVSFFNGKSETRTSEKYIEIRNWIMKKFHDDPNKPIELKDLAELPVGDSDAKQEVMEFLDYWGLINFHPFPSKHPAATSADEDKSGEDENSASIIEKLFHFETIESCAPIVPKTSLAAPTWASGLFSESAIAEELARPEDPNVDYHCNSCSADCSRKRYHCQKQADFDLCSECYNNGKFGSGMSSSDFILMEPAEAPGLGSGKWTDQETLLLLEALELYKENWNEIAEHVATKTRTQCILHFLQMPIEDTFLDGEDQIDATPQENVDTGTSNNDDTSVPKDAPEMTETKTSGTEGQPQSTPVESSKPATTSEDLLTPTETSKAEEANQVKVSEESGDNYALKALKEACEAVGFVDLPDGPFSFADVGNPAMALATEIEASLTFSMTLTIQYIGALRREVTAFLAKLVEPNVVTVSARSCLKSISDVSPGMQLAARHCFILEDPPDEKKETTGPGSAVAEDAQKDGNEKEENAVPVTDQSTFPNDQAEKKTNDCVSEEKKSIVSPDSNGNEKSMAAEVRDPVATSQKVGLTNMDEPQRAKMPKETLPGGSKESDKSTPNVDIHSISVESGDKPSEAGSEAAKNTDMVIDSLLPEKKYPVQPVSSATVVENRAKKGHNSYDDHGKECKNKNDDPTKTKDHDMDKLKRAATTALTAAAVKAKLFADQEEDQIRRLTMHIIEKQLHKLEAKLMFFSEVDNVVLKIRELLERSRQKLYQERAQIIASRLGLPASSSRAMPPQSLPNNRMAMNFANTIPRPPTGMAFQRPPLARPTMSSAPFMSSSFASNMATGNSVRPPSQDKVSSVGTK
ncbi:SMARCC, C-terminal [Dillenia turbinata]|uniref:SMARCC, C-terminal n=1 Tax=Dillenia turbinata TaxID=194707 RepID=A0AAN8W527_9MAGN